MRPSGAVLTSFAQDTHVLEDKFTGNDSSAFFAVYDGHGGKHISDLCAANFHKVRY